MCRVLKVSPGGCCAWLWPHNEKILGDSHRLYGYRCVYEELVKMAILTSHRRVARLMKQHGRRVRPFRRYVVNTKTGKRQPDMPDLVQREFDAKRPNTVWVSDITDVRTARG